MGIFFSAEKLACYPEEFKADYDAAGNWPEDGKEISRAQFEKFFLSTPPAGYKIGSNDGVPSWVDDTEYLKDQESGWALNEIKRCADEIYKVQDADPSATGTEAEWRAYRVAVRAWPQHENFPDKAYRPSAPDA